MLAVLAPDPQGRDVSSRGRVLAYKVVYLDLERDEPVHIPATSRDLSWSWHTLDSLLWCTVAARADISCLLMLLRPAPQDALRIGCGYML